MTKFDRPMVHDIGFMLEWYGLNATPSEFKAYVSGLWTGLRISKIFVASKALTLRNDTWKVLRGEMDPAPSIEEFIAEINRTTFEKISLTPNLFKNPDLRYGSYYSTGIKDATMLALVQIPRLYNLAKVEDWQSKVQFWIDQKLEILDYLV